jgi:hypothetical protein
VLYDALLHLGYNRDVPVYRGCMSMAHGLDQCELSMTIHLKPMESWMAIVIGVELDDTVEQMAQVALTSLCGSHLTDTAVMPIALFPTCYQGDPMWKQCLEAMSDPEGPHFHACMAEMAKYKQYPFNLQHTTTRTVIHQRLTMGAYDKRTHAIIHLEHTNEQQDLELKERATMIASLE